METTNQQFPWLELIDRPAFCVKDGVLVAVNAAAEHRMLRLGTDVRQIVAEHRSAYEQFENGRLYLTVTVCGQPCNASITRTKECDIFILEQNGDDDQLQALALAAQHLRIPLSNAMTVADQLLSSLDSSDSQVQKQTSQINHSLFQLLRIISNMSDACGYRETGSSGIELLDLVAVFDEIIEKVQSISSDTGVTVSYTSLNISVFSIANPEKLERAVYNLLSNAIKFSPSGSTVDVKLSKNDKSLSFTVSNPSIPDEAHGIWNCYRREPAIEDTRYGLGLGMTLVSSVASAHGGTLLIDHPEPDQTRVTMSLPIVKEQSSTVRSPLIRIGDYAGGRDKALLELAELLNATAYMKIN